MATKNSRSKSTNGAKARTARPAESEKAVAPAAAPAVAVAPAPVVAVAAPAAPTPRPVEAQRDRSAVIALIAKLRDPDAEVARDAAGNLGRLPSDGDAVAALCEVIRNADGYFHSVVRAAAAGSLGLLGDRAAVDALIFATGDSMAETSEEAIKALGLLGDARALPVLEAVVRNENGYFLEHVRQTAQAAVGRIAR